MFSDKICLIKFCQLCQNKLNFIIGGAVNIFPKFNKKIINFYKQ